ncbi:hypothetical protein CYMTET_54219 [Cymbomonas tetramitiformis]|uniref:Uncharacterized protein n=1 Tax=Cymbomonas tetramitiformis TaxID=36881 RepID=A0AAE0BH58_9CHLO|nr:hypothetical protein CYMTET_54219 [Cymbomonas tetramitiformis]
MSSTIESSEATSSSGIIVTNAVDYPTSPMWVPSCKFPSVNRSQKRPRTPTDSDEHLFDNMRKEKRYLTEVMANNLAKLNVAHMEEDMLNGAEATSGWGASRGASLGGHQMCDRMALSSSPLSSPESPRSPAEGAAYSELSSGGASPRVAALRISTQANSIFKPPHLSSHSRVVAPWRTSTPLGLASSPPTSVAGTPVCATSPRAGGAPMLSPRSSSAAVDSLSTMNAIEKSSAAASAAASLPPSPSDPSMVFDLRRTVLLRSTQMRVEVEEEGEGDPTEAEDGFDKGVKRVTDGVEIPANSEIHDDWSP